ncbi:hypothetical protein, partial [Dokdonella sp.]|uniref:hypothetical protein n=1 Tax=Dokdonella sp. TaxID=2291710 RepID=UPI002635703E
MVMQRRDGGGRAVLGRIEEGQATHGGEPAFVRHTVGAIGRRLLLDGDHGHQPAVLIEAGRHGLDLGAHLVGHRQDVVARLGRRAD